MIDNNAVVEVLRSVKDPNTGIDLVSARRVKELKITDNQIMFTLEVNDLSQEAKFAINAEAYALLKDAFKKAEIHIHEFARLHRRKKILDINNNNKTKKNKLKYQELKQLVLKSMNLFMLFISYMYVLRKSEREREGSNLK